MRFAGRLHYFDHSAGADPAAKYEVRTVDGAGNASAGVLAVGPEAVAMGRSRIVDDAPGAGITYTGPWQSQAGLQPAHAGTLTTSDQQGATASITFEGRRVLWFSKLGANGGKAAVSVDGAPAEMVDTYSADDIWGVCVYRREFPAPGRHTLEIKVLGQHGSRTKGSLVALDGLRIES